MDNISLRSANEGILLLAMNLLHMNWLGKSSLFRPVLLLRPLGVSAWGSSESSGFWTIFTLSSSLSTAM